MFDDQPQHGRGGGLLADLVHALAFLSRLPLPAPAATAPASLARVARAFPAAGLALGALAALAYAACWSLGLSALLSALLATALLVWLARGLHEDGLADLADGLAGPTPERRLEIMRDSHIGAFGVLALVLVLAVRVAALAEVAEPGAAARVLIAGAALSRAAMVVLMSRLPPARPDGLGHAAGRPDRDAVTLAVATGLAATFLLLPWSAAILCSVLAALGALAVGWLARERLGGITGDVLGAGQQVAEAGFLLAAAIALA